MEEKGIVLLQGVIGGNSEGGSPATAGKHECTGQQYYALPILQILLGFWPVFCHVTATGLLTALSTFQVVRRIQGLASRAGVVLSEFFEPLFIANRFDSLKIVSELYPMRHCRLKQFQVIAGIFFHE
jgi:hypothetical protein